MLKRALRSSLIGAVLVAYGAVTGAGQVALAQGPALQIEKVAGDGGTGIFGSSRTPTVRVKNAGKPAANVEVRFAVVDGVGTLVDTVVVTGKDGTASTLWLLGAVEGKQVLRAIVRGDSVEFSATATAPVVGESYLGRNDYIEYIPGELPIILSSPHDGALRPQEIPDRTEGTLARDLNTQDLTRRIARALEQRTGKKPHVVFNHLHRRKLDPNRSIPEATNGYLYSIYAWYEYHTWLDIAGDKAAADYSRGLHLDIHGHSHPVQRVELGYMVRGNVLNQSDEELNKDTHANRSSIRNLASTSPLTFAELLRGEESLGEMLVKRGIRAIPSKSDPRPGDEPYFSHGYTLIRHGSRDGGTIDAIMLEHNRELRSAEENRDAYANELADAILEFMAKHYGIELRRVAN